MALADMRKDYALAGLLEKDLAKNPFQQFEQWFQEAEAAKVVEPNAMSLATTGRARAAQLPEVPTLAESGLAGYEAYVVGGAVRDALLGRPAADRDWVVVGATPEALAALDPAGLPIGHEGIPPGAPPARPGEGALHPLPARAAARPAVRTTTPRASARSVRNTLRMMSGVNSAFRLRMALAAVVSFLMREDASYVTRQVIAVNGGLTA